MSKERRSEKILTELRDNTKPYTQDTLVVTLLCGVVMLGGILDTLEDMKQIQKLEFDRKVSRGQ